MPPVIALSRRLGIVDLGSNSARLMVAHYSPGYAFKIVDELSRRVRLGEGLAAGKELRPAAMARALETLTMFRAYCAAEGVAKVTAVATAAVRDAVNGPDFLRQAQTATGWPMRILTGEQEAHLGALGAMHATGVRSGLVLDVGGGSAEVSRVQAGRFGRGLTVPFGAVRLTELFLGGGEDRPRVVDVRRLTEHIAAVFQTLDWMKLAPGEHLVGLGGTARALARIDRQTQGYPLGLTNNYDLPLDRLEALVERLADLSAEARVRKIAGLQEERADIILAGALVVAQAMRRAGAGRLRISGQGLREGLLYQAFYGRAAEPLHSDWRQFSVLNLARLYNFEAEHAAHVTRLALILFDQLADLHDYGDAERDCLWAAGHLHDIGTVVDYYDHHKHSAYIIASAGLPGWTQRETALIALLCQYHRSGRPNLGAYESLGSPGDHERLERLAALLRLAESLDRTRARAVTGLRVEVKRETIRLLVRVRNRQVGRVEVWEAQSNAGLFEAAYGRRLVIE